MSKMKLFKSGDSYYNIDQIVKIDPIGNHTEVSFSDGTSFIGEGKIEDFLKILGSY